MGVLAYLTYIIVTILNVRQDGLDKQSVSLLLLGWAFLYAANLIVQGGKVKKDKELPYE